MSDTDITKASPTPDLDALPRRYRDDVERLFSRWERLRARNAVLTGYVEMRRKVRDLGISIPPQLLDTNVAVGWADKAVRVRAVRSKFDGYAFEGVEDRSLDVLARRNRLSYKYDLACRGALTHGVAALSVMRGTGRQPPVMVRAFSANQCCLDWDKDADGVGCGVVATACDAQGTATRYVLHEPDAVVLIAREGSGAWSCEVQPHLMGRPLLVAVVHDPDADRPLGHPVVTPEVMGIIDKAMRDVLRMEVGAEFFTAPQRYILGATDDLFDPAPLMAEDVVVEDTDGNVVGGADRPKAPPSPQAMMRAYIGSFLAITRDANGELPQVGQFPAGSADNFVKVFENDAQRFSGATNVPLGQLGVLSNTYTSSDALGAANDPLILDVERINERNAESMEEVARMMMAIRDGVAYDDLTDDQMLVQALFCDPSQPTLAARADAWTKMAGADSSLVGTRVWYEGLGFKQATIDRIMAERQRAGAIDLLNGIADQLGAQAADNG